MPSAYYVCCINPSAFQIRFDHGSRHYEPWSDVGCMEQSDLGPYCVQYRPCADQESFVRRFSVCVCVFLVDAVREDQNKSKSGPSSARQRNAIEIAFRWRADGGPTLDAAWFFRESGPVLLRNPIFL